MCLIELGSAGGFAIGALENSRYLQQEVELLPGDSIVIYTDGVTEAENERGDLYTYERFARVIARAPAAAPELMDTLLEDGDAYTGKAAQTDDLTLVCVSVEPRES